MTADTTYLITGGTGTFGQAYVRYLLRHRNPAKVIVYSRDEQKQDAMDKALQDARMRFFIGDVRDRARLLMALEGVDVVISAAALKIVPSIEYNPFEALETNVLGAAQNVLLAAKANGVGRVIYLSSDKAVAPVNTYGVSKAMGERLIIAGSAYAGSAGTRFSAVRYGNVAGSRGSVIPVWRDQLAAGQPITVTDPSMTRYWMRIEQAVKFVDDALYRMKGGEVFVPELASFTIEQLARVMIQHHGRGDYRIVGIRSGEKLHERLIVLDEARRTFHVPGFGYVVTRQPDILTKDSAPDDGTLCPEGFEHSSDWNKVWLTDDELAAELELVP